jgi:hypothetical protein
MLRRSVTYLLILSVAVGPTLCCCTAGRLHAALPSRLETTSSPVPVSRVKATYSCCSHKQQSTDQEVGQTSSQSKPAPQKPAEKCPCKDKDSADRLKFAPTEVASVDVKSLLRLTLSFDAGSLLSPECFSLQAPGTKSLIDRSRGSNASLVSTYELLFAHHNLRC